MKRNPSGTRGQLHDRFRGNRVKTQESRNKAKRLTVANHQARTLARQTFTRNTERFRVSYEQKGLAFYCGKPGHFKNRMQEAPRRAEIPS